MASVQTGAAIATTLFPRLGPAGAVFLRLASAALILLALWRPDPRGRPVAHIRMMVAFGLVLAGMNLCFYEALDRLPLGIVVAVEFLGPLTVAVVGSRRALDLLWGALAAVGVLALTHPAGTTIDGLGLAFALAAGALWGLYILLSARIGLAFEGSDGLALALCVAALVMLPFGLAVGGTQLFRPEALLIGAAVGLLSSAIPYTFELEALRRIRPPVFGVLMSLEPGIAALVGFLVLGQTLGPRALLGILLVTLASLGASRQIVDTAMAA
jgi:inner membrane transporter RhtA